MSCSAESLIHLPRYPIRSAGLLTSLLALQSVVCAPLAGQESAAAEVIVRAADGTPVVVDAYAGSGSRGVIALFHQGGGDARGEYGFLIDRLRAAGYELLAADLHGGGDRFGSTNRTMQQTPEPASFTYCDARPQLDAVIDEAVRRAAGRPVLLWGSSYSGALVLHAAAARGAAISGVLAFSPASGAPMAGCRANAVRLPLPMPVLILRPSSEAGIPSVAEELRLFEASGLQTYVAEPGAHGSSMLNAERAGGDVSATWDRVWRFLDSVTPRGPGAG